MNKWLKLSLIVVGILLIAYLSYRLITQIGTPINYDKELKVREAAVIDRIKDIRLAEQAFKQKNQRYTGSWDTLINFVLNDSMLFERKLVDENDSVAMAQLKRSGRANSETFMVPVIDTIFSPKRLTEKDIQDIRFIPYAEPGTEYILNAAMFTTESKVVVPVFEAKAPYKLFMHDLDHQELVNLIDESKNVYRKYPGIMVGDITKATNDAGNWE